MPQVVQSLRVLTVLASAAGASAALFTPSVADAHISFEAAGVHLSRYGDGEIKDGPCGRAGGTRGEHVYTYEPGQTITISTVEFIPHPGYFRIAFDADGDDDFMEPRSIKPVDPNRKCPYDANDKCGASDFYNTPAVLMDNLDPHLAGAKKTYTWQVKLPDIECDNCTLQLIQVMEDTVHGPYSPKGASNEAFYVEDIYHQCIDIVLKKGSSPDDNPPAGGDAGSEDASDAGAAGGDGDGPGTGQPGDGDSTGDGDGKGDSAGDGDQSGAAAVDSGSDGCSVARGAARGALASLFMLVAGAVLVRRRKARG